MSGVFIQVGAILQMKGVFLELSTIFWMKDYFSDGKQFSR